MNTLMELLKVLEHSHSIAENIKINPQWLAGFIEAEGHFHGKAGQQPHFSISQHAADFNLIEAISKYVGHGKTRLSVRPDGRAEAVYTVYSKKVLEDKIIPLCAENLISEKKSKQFMDWTNAHFPHCQSIALPDPDKKIDPNWLVGFVDGDGSFYSLIHKAKDYKHGYQVQAVFDIAQLDSERSLLQKIGDQFFDSTHRWAKSKDTQHMRIMSQKGLVNYVEPFFDENKLLSRKEYDFLLWKEMLKIIKNKEHTTPVGLQRIKELRDLQNYFRTHISPETKKLIEEKFNNKYNK